LRSIEAQSYPVHELIVLDDASTDNSLEHIQSFQEQSKLNIILLNNSQNSGSVFKQWIKGIEAASGDYIWIAEADDLSEHTFLEIAMKGFEDPDVILSYTLSKIIGSDGETISENYRHATDDINTERWLQDYIRNGEEEIADTFVVKNTIPNVSSAVFKKIDFSSIKEKLTMFKVAGDWYFYYYLLQKGSIAYSAQPLNLYRRHNDSVVNNSINNRRHYEEIVIMQHLIYNRYSISEQSWEIALSHRLTMKKWLKIYKDSIEKYLFVMTYGESGSEKLLGFLNNIKHVDIKGENMGVLNHLYQTYVELNKAKKYAGETSKDTADAWYGIHTVKPQLFAIESCSLFVEQVLQPSKDTKITGFKEIRFLNKDKAWLNAYVDFLFDFFPNSSIIFYHADVEKVAKTGFWKEQNYATLLPQLTYLDQWMRECHQRYPKHTLQLYDNDFINGSVNRLETIML